MGMPPWVLLTVAAIGFLGSIFGALAAFGGVMLTQRRSDRRDAAAWAREREREHAHWAREDAARTFAPGTKLVGDITYSAQLFVTNTNVS